VEACDSRRNRWSEIGIFARTMDGLTSEATIPKMVMINATYVKAHCRASSLRLK
jgi:hypothetical protein